MPGKPGSRGLGEPGPPRGMLGGWPRWSRSLGKDRVWGVDSERARVGAGGGVPWALSILDPGGRLGGLLGLFPASKDSTDGKQVVCELRPRARTAEARNRKGPQEPALVGAAEAEGLTQEPAVPRERSGFLGIYDL